MLIRCTDRSGNIYNYYTPGFTVSGSVVDEDDKPLAGIVMSLGPYHITVSDSAGHYVFGGIPGGDYTLTATSPDYEFPSVLLTVSGDTTVPEVAGESTAKLVFLPLVVRGR